MINITGVIYEGKWYSEKQILALTCAEEEGFSVSQHSLKDNPVFSELFDTTKDCKFETYDKVSNLLSAIKEKGLYLN